MLSAWRFMQPFVPAFALLLAAVFLGRYFCGWMCPLGATIDVVDWMTDKVGIERNEKHGAGVSWTRRLKYYVLITCLVCAVFGVSVFGYVDPLSIAMRSYVLVVHPFLLKTLLPVLEILSRIPVFGPVAAWTGEQMRMAFHGGAQIEFALQVVTAAAILGVIGLTVAGRRMWCRSVCPLGALYALAGIKSYTGRQVSDACIECGRCADVCPTNCISDDGHQTLAGECILCMRCQEECPVDAIRFLGASREQMREVDLTRRGTVAAMGAAVAACPLFTSNASESIDKGGTFVRPPLADRDPDEFLQECLRCGQCMRVCPTQAIQPAGLEGGLESLWTPQLIPRLGYCEYNCDRCGQVCPTGAIPEFDLKEKHASAIGLAYLDRTRCIPWRGWQHQLEEDVDWDKHNCGVCEEVCPVPGKAIHFRRREMGDGQELRLPYVRAESCVGCGFCENVCPVQGEAAIRVTGGFRELGPPDEGAATGSAIASALPVTVGNWRLTGEKTVRTTENELFSWINGAAEPYLKFQFAKAANARYAREGANAEIIAWEFKHSDDAFGVYSKFRAADGDRLDFADRVTVAEGPVLWAWEDKWYIKVLPLGGDLSRKDVTSLGRAVVEGFKAPPADIPDICRKLPESGRKAGTMRFMRHALHLHDLYLPMAINDAVQLKGKSVAAYADYEGGTTGTKTGLLLVDYPKPREARDAWNAYEKACKEMGQTEERRRGVTLCKMGDNNYSAAGKQGELLAIAIGWGGAEQAMDIVRKVTDR